MADPRNYQDIGAISRADDTIDQGLRSYMLRVYNYMAVAVAITGIAAYAVFSMATTLDPSMAAATSPSGIYLTSLGVTLWTTPLKWVVMFAPLALVMVLSFGINKLSLPAAQGVFLLYSALVGVSISTIFLVYTSTSIVHTFFISAAAFGALSLYGYTTKRDLSGFGTFLMMGLFGLIIASVVNIFLKSDMLQWVVSCAGVLIFAGLTAYDTQKIKEMYFEGDNKLVAGRKALMGALSLYLDFLNLFLFLLQFMGNRD